MTAGFSPIAPYVLGTACFSRGLVALYSPRTEYPRMGLQLESQNGAVNSLAAEESSHGGSVSPLMYFKGLREISYGLTLVALQKQGNEAAITTFAAIISLVRFGDGLVVWLHGGEELQHRAWGHWITGAGFVGWVIWRLKQH